MTGMRIAARQLARNPAFSTIVVLTLALGIGATTAIFSLFYQVLVQVGLIATIGAGLGLAAALAVGRVAPLEALRYE